MEGIHRTRVYMRYSWTAQSTRRCGLVLQNLKLLLQNKKKTKKRKNKKKQMLLNARKSASDMPERFSRESTATTKTLQQTPEEAQEEKTNHLRRWLYRDLHEKHESWLLPFEGGNHGILSVSEPSLHMDNTLHPDIKDRVFYLEGNHMHSSIHKVPALVSDCQPNITAADILKQRVSMHTRLAFPCYMCRVYCLIAA
ncbi:Uncharacterized protein Rs2_05323 [Raphanus sativus]|nr:Uncharacterized protein Rs2_05323 [Raphanus sativus]